MPHVRQAPQLHTGIILRASASEWRIGERLPAHTCEQWQLVFVLDGMVEETTDGRPLRLRAGRVLVMDAGKIALEGAPRDVFEKTEEIRRMGLDVPPMAQLAAQLRAEGLPLRADIMTVEEMAVELCRLKSVN